MDIHGHREDIGACVLELVFRNRVMSSPASVAIYIRFVDILRRLIFSTKNVKGDGEKMR